MKLQHHGILGQKWGKRNGPPYPLGASDHSQSEKRAGYQRSLAKAHAKNKTGGIKSKKENEESKRKGLSDKQKKAIKIGAAVTVAALATYGTYKLAKSGKLNNIVSNGRDKMESMGFGNADKSKINEVFGKPINRSFEESMMMDLNPNHPNRGLYGINGSVLKTIDNEYVAETNCMACSINHDLNRRGFDTITALIDTRTFDYDKVLNDIYENPKRIKMDTNGDLSNLTKKLAKYRVGSRGNIDFRWTSNYGGHIMNWEVVRKGFKKEVVFIDRQNGVDFTDTNIFDLAYDANVYTFSYIRTDNLKLKDNPEYIKKFAIPIKRET